MQNNICVIGLTGGTGTGKTTICEILKKHNAVIIDADKIGHEIIKKGKPAYIELVEFFNNINSYNILDKNKEIDRKLLGNIVFNNNLDNNFNNNLEFLTKTTHKYIIKKILDDIEYYKNNNFNNKYIVLDAPLLIEANLHKYVNSVWIVNANLNTRLERLKLRDNLPDDILLKRIESQTPFNINKKFADVIINNNFNNNLDNNLDNNNFKDLEDLVIIELSKLNKLVNQNYF